MAANPLCAAAAALALALAIVAAARFAPPIDDALIKLPSESEELTLGTRWAILVAGSSGYGNYRHQADVCHAYQVLKRGGLKEENIVVFMYDDIAGHLANPHPGKIFNRPGGTDVYGGVPKDYTGKYVNVNNFFAVILGNKTAITGGSGKVVDSGPNDHIFIFYSDHGGPGILGMPTYPHLYANELVDVLMLKHSARTYKEMVIYVEACESGSIFDGILPDDLNIYVTTAANPDESSWGAYCPSTFPPAPPEFQTCLGDLYSVSWMEDSEIHNLKEETLNQQYQTVKLRTSNHNTYISGSHVMQYGDVKADAEKAYIYIGSDPLNDNISILSDKISTRDLQLLPRGEKFVGVLQRDADLLYLWIKYQMANEGSGEKLEAQLDLMKEIENRMRLDKRVEVMGKLLFGSKAGSSVLKAVRAPGQPLVDDWKCLKSMVATFESQCGTLGQYGMKYMRAFANICNAGIDANRMGAEMADSCIHNDLLSESWSVTEHSLVNLF